MSPLNQCKALLARYYRVEISAEVFAAEVGVILHNWHELQLAHEVQALERERDPRPPVTG